MSSKEQVVESLYRDLYRFGLLLFGDPEPSLKAVQDAFTDWDQQSERDHRKSYSNPKVDLFEALYQRWKLHQSPQVRRVPASLIPLVELDPEHRVPLLLFYLKRHSIPEISKILKIPGKEIRVRIVQAQKRISRPASASSPRGLV